MAEPRWERCINHRGTDAAEFIREYFGNPDRRTLLVAAAGFDPRSPVLAEFMAGERGSRSQGLIIREGVPDVDADLLERATANQARIEESLGTVVTAVLDVIDSDGAVVLGRKAVGAVEAQAIGDLTDIIVDVSAMSIGASFPIVRFFLERVDSQAPNVNLHVVVISDPELDAAIQPTASDVESLVHGFRGEWGLDERAAAARLWMPHLTEGRRWMLDQIHQAVDPHDIVPVLPFPSKEPRRGDLLVEDYLEQLDGAWDVDLRNMVYAHETSPLDLYRTTLRIDDARRPVFREIGGSLLVLSPIGSKTLAIGSMLAAIERDFPVMYVEATGYDVSPTRLDAFVSSPESMVHLWLAGEGYA